MKKTNISLVIKSLISTTMLASSVGLSVYADPLTDAPAAIVASSPSAVNIAKVERAIADAMTKFQVPGLAIAIVDHGQVVLAKGFGVRHNQTKEPVTADTLFGIASNSKAFTATAVLMLQEQGKLTLDDKVSRYLPELRYHDNYVSQELTIRDLLSHRAGLGLGAGDLMIWPNSDKSMTDIIAGMAHLKPASSFRSQYAYNNLGFVLAGEVVKRVSGQSWQEFVEQQIFSKVGMSNSYAAFSRVPKSNHNWATGHIPLDGKVSPFFIDYLEDFSSAGSIAANVNDMAKWLQVQIQHGQLANGERLISEQSWQQMIQPNITMPVSSKATEEYGMHFRGYGLGVNVQDMFGARRISHGGGILGMISHTSWVPEKQIGVVVLTNQQSSAALGAIVSEIYEDVFAQPDKDWVGDNFKKYQEMLPKLLASKTPAKISKPRKALPLKNYAGTYHDAWYGDVVITEQKSKLRISFSHTPLLVGTLKHYTGDTFIVNWDEPMLEADAFIDFSVDSAQQVTRAAIKAISDVTDFSFDFQDLDLQKQVTE